MISRSHLIICCLPKIDAELPQNHVLSPWSTRCRLALTISVANHSFAVYPKADAELPQNYNGLRKTCRIPKKCS